MEKAYVNGQQKDFSTMKKVGSKTVDGTIFTMYVSKNNKYYIHCTGKVNEAMNVDFQSAKKWAENNLTKQEFDSHFGTGGRKNVEVFISVDKEVANTIERIRGNTGKSYGQITEESINYVISLYSNSNNAKGGETT